MVAMPNILEPQKNGTLRRLEAAQVTSVSDAGKLILGFMGHPEFVRPTYYRLQESVQLQVRPTAFRGKGENSELP